MYFIYWFILYPWTIKVHLEIVNASLTRKLAEFYEKYNKTRAHLEEIKTVITNHNLKNILQENIDLCKTRVKTELSFFSQNFNLFKFLQDKLQKEVFNLKCHFQDLSRTLLEKVKLYKTLKNRYVYFIHRDIVSYCTVH